VLAIGSCSPRTGWSRVARPSAASMVVVMAVVLAATLLSQAPAVATTPTSVARLEARLADLDGDLAVLRGTVAELRSEADRLTSERDRALGWVERLRSQRAATAELHHAHLDVSHRRTTTEQVDEALAALLVRSGLDDGTTDWFREQFAALDGAGPAPPDAEAPTLASTVDATSGAPTPAGGTGHLQLRYAVRAALVFTALHLQLDEAEQLVDGPQRQLDAGVMPALTAAEARAGELQGARDRLASELAEEQRRLERAASRHFPVDGAHRVSSGFGMRRHPVHGDVRMHHGLDLAAPTGTPVVAAEPGRVAMAGSRGGYGLVVDIDHGDGVLTRYAHLNTIEVRQGERLAGGQRLGTVGATGTVTGPHLHFEVRLQGRSIDPAQWLALAPRRR
jgi:septal ring factor EnvC (AmiA/AmiB activator)